MDRKDSELRCLKACLAVLQSSLIYMGWNLEAIEVENLTFSTIT